MKLLITTQVVDKNDPVLGFFVRWIEEFAKHCEQIEVICLRSAEYTLPANVRVHPLNSKTKIGRALELMGLSKRLTYDSVFVHMNPEYLVAAGWLWKMRGKKIALWYMHKAVNVRLRIAELFADVILTASKESFRLKSSKIHIVGHGIDMDIFYPDPSVPRGEWALSLGRLTKSKRHDMAIDMAHRDGRKLTIVGDGPEREPLEEYAKKLGATVEFLGGIPHAKLGDIYRRAAYFIHTSETGSLDKVVLEAIACGCPVRTTDPALKFLENESPEYVRKNHSLETLIPKIISALS